jgi:hypothetical protein
VDGQPAQPAMEAQALALNQAAIDEWDQREINARAMISFNVDEDQQVSIRGCRTAKKMWDQLNMEYSLMAPDHAIMSLEYFQYKYNPSHTISGHIATLKRMYDELLGTPGQVSEEQLKMVILKTLPPGFDRLRSAWDIVPIQERTVTALTSRQIIEERRTLEKYNGQRDPNNVAYLAVNTTHSEQGFATQSHQRGGRGGNPGYKDKRGDYEGRGRRYNTPNSDEKRCFYCNKPNHIKIDCRTRMRHEAEERERNARKDVVSKNRDNNTKKNGFYSSSTCFSARSNYDFFADSGASHHMSDQRSYFSSMTPIQKGAWLVKGIGGVTLPVLGQGSIDFIATVDGKQYPGEFTKVLFVPSLNANLISVGTATNAGIEIVFTGNTVLFKHKGIAIMTGQRSGKELYHLNITVTHNNDQTTAAVAKQKVPLSIVHKRFAHLNCRAIRRMAEKNVVDALDLQDSKTPPDPCNGCIYGKMHRTPFPIGRTRATRPDQIIHSDVGGPFTTPSICGGRYYVSFKDDFSGYLEGFIIKHKSEVKELFVQLCAATKRQTGRQIEILRTDMGKEYEGQWFDDYLAKEGIKHEPPP